MNKNWAEPEHVGKITISILNTLTGEFYKESAKDEKDYSLLIKLASAIGYQSQLYSSLWKNHEFSKRLQSIEKELQSATPEDLALGRNPAVIAEEEEKSRLDGR